MCSLHFRYRLIKYQNAPANNNVKKAEHIIYQHSCDVFTVFSVVSTSKYLGVSL